MNKELELEAEKYIEKVWGGYKDDIFKHDDIITDYAEDSSPQIDFIAGATSNAAKEYWYKQFEKQKLEFAIEYLYLVRNSCFDIENRIQELEQKLSEL